MTAQIQRRLLWTAGTAIAALIAVPAAAQTDTPATKAASSKTTASAAKTDIASQDIIVTATKRAESLSQVAMPISAISGDQLEKMNANSLSDYINRLPGVVFNDYQPGVSEVVIRGIAATTYHEQGQTTVGYYINEINVVEPGFPIAIPDVDTFDLKRVEVLRGPQGTLFGSSTLGGLVNYVVNTADPSKVDAAAEGIVSYTHNADGQPNYAGKVMVNLPIIKDKLAVRVMALQRYDAGYIDNIGLTPPKKATNNLRTRGLRGSIVFTPAEGTKITYLSMYQDTKLDDQTYISVNHSYTRSTGREEPQKTSFFLNSLRLDQDLGDFATLTVLGSVDEKTNYTLFTDPYGYVTGTFTGPNVAYDYANANANIKTIEARLASKGDGPLTWLIGTSYLRAKKYYFDQMFAPGAESYINAHPGDFAYSGDVLAPNDRIYGYLSDTLNTDFGVFGEVTWKPVKGLELTVGGRYYDTLAEGDVTNKAGFVSGSPVDLSGHVDKRENGFTPKATIAIRPNSHLLAYLTYSRGYRVGGINPNAGLLATIPTSYASDTVDNYEAGVKTTLWDRLTIDASVYDIVWKGIQARLFGPAPQYYSYVSNAGSANVVGVEFSGSLAVTPHLNVSSNVTYTDAELTRFLPDTFAVGGGYQTGTTLPGSSKWSVASTINYDRNDLPGQPSLAIAHRYLSKAPVAFGSDSTRGDFNIFDLRASVTLLHQFRLMAFADNVFNEYGILNAPFTSQAAPAYSIVRPRTFGLRVDWKLR
ncbi:TonB-dependent receptor [Stakelama sediminis]|uniref:Outer membrane receptor protein involved in Fe transport n=1 Tax=Stakelama sediminis TaxID=463200 RepID=A0A840Z3M4_9SPHN|nr:TonB-dependent receptor [Stakelama sediminis]MBB5720337.1 outer membrane receptor protein involved in Fe transport [Stakelama sediminis]